MIRTAVRCVSMYCCVPIWLCLSTASLGCGPGEQAPVRLCPAGVTSDPSVPVLHSPPADGFSAVGYLTHDVGDAYGNPSCGAILVHTRVALTAVHCLERALITQGARVGFGLGEICGRVIPAVQLVPFSEPRDYSAPGKQNWDLAAVILSEPVVGVQPAGLADAQTDCASVHVGYGRKVAGDSHVRAGYDGTRRSLPMCVSSTSDGILASSSEGSPCFGDSGSPLLERGSGSVLGILSGFAAPLAEVRCAPNEAVVYTSLDPRSERANFVRSVISAVERGTY